MVFFGKMVTRYYKYLVVVYLIQKCVQPTLLGDRRWSLRFCALSNFRRISSSPNDAIDTAEFKANRSLALFLRR